MIIARLEAALCGVRREGGIYVSPQLLKDCIAEVAALREALDAERENSSKLFMYGFNRREETIEECAKALDDLADDPFFRNARIMTDAAKRIRDLKGRIAHPSDIVVGSM